MPKITITIEGAELEGGATLAPATCSAQEHSQIRNLAIQECMDVAWEVMREWEKKYNINAGAGIVRHKLEALKR